MTLLERRTGIIAGAAASVLGAYLFAADTSYAQTFMQQVRQDALTQAQSFNAPLAEAEARYKAKVTELRPRMAPLQRQGEEAARRAGETQAKMQALVEAATKPLEEKLEAASPEAAALSYGVVLTLLADGQDTPSENQLRDLYGALGLTFRANQTPDTYRTEVGSKLDTLSRDKAREVIRDFSKNKGYPITEEDRAEYTHFAKSLSVPPAQRGSPKTFRESILQRMDQRARADLKIQESLLKERKVLTEKVESGQEYRTLKTARDALEQQGKKATAELEGLVKGQMEPLEAQVKEFSIRRRLAVSAYGLMLHVDRNDNHQLEAEEQQALMTALRLPGSFSEGAMRKTLSSLEMPALLSAIKTLYGNGFPFTPADEKEWQRLQGEARQPTQTR